MHKMFNCKHSNPLVTFLADLFDRKDFKKWFLIEKNVKRGMWYPMNLDYKNNLKGIVTLLINSKRDEGW